MTLYSCLSRLELPPHILYIISTGLMGVTSLDWESFDLKTRLSWLFAIKTPLICTCGVLFGRLEVVCACKLKEKCLDLWNWIDSARCAYGWDSFFFFFFFLKYEVSHLVERKKCCKKLVMDFFLSFVVLPLFNKNGRFLRFRVYNRPFPVHLKFCFQNNTIIRCHLVGR